MVLDLAGVSAVLVFCEGLGGGHDLEVMVFIGMVDLMVSVKRGCFKRLDDVNILAGVKRYCFHDGHAHAQLARLGVPWNKHISAQRAAREQVMVCYSLRCMTMHSIR